MIYTRPDDFYVTQLSTNERKAYDIIVRDLLDLKTRITLTGVRFTDYRKSHSKITNALSISRPDIFYETPISTLERDFSGNYIISFDFAYTKSQIIDYRNQLSKICSDFCKSVANYHSEYEIILAINRYLSEHVVYENDSSVEGGNSVGALIKGKARCEGIAQAFKLLADSVGITSFMAVGRAVGNQGLDNHAWNIVRYRGKYYHIDPTFNLGCKVVTEPLDCPLFFMMSDEQVLETHFGDWNYPRCVDSSQEFYTKHQLRMKKPEDLRYLPFFDKDGKKYFVAKLEWMPTRKDVIENCVYWLAEPCRKHRIMICGASYDEKRGILKAFN